MAGQIIIFSKTITVSGGVGSVNTTAANGFQSWEFGGLVRNIYLKAPLVGDTFDFRITSPNSNITYHRKNITTKLVEERVFAVRGTHTITIDNASRDGDYLLEIGFEVGRE